jgi:DNA-binding MarR family transcriptional regulator
MGMSRPLPSARTAFLLSQVGSLSSALFADRVRSLELSPADAGVLRQLGRNPGLSQRELADRIGVAPSRLVGIIDSLSSRGLVARARSTHDRRNYELVLSDEGHSLLAALRDEAERHEDELLAPLSTVERARLAELVERLARGHGLSTELHRETGVGRS